jgi:hypothetical protein
MQVDYSEILQKRSAMYHLINTLLRFKVAKSRIEYWGFSSVHKLETAMDLHIERLLIKEQEAEELVKQEHDNWGNTIAQPITFTADAVGSMFTITEIYVDESYYYCDEEYIRMEINELATLDLHHQFHLSSQAQDSEQRRCRCRSPSSFGVENV